MFLSEPACIVLAQELAPHWTRIASSMVMGLAWGIAGLELLGTGVLADRIGIEKTLYALILLPAGALLSSSFCLENKNCVSGITVIFFQLTMAF